MSSQDISTPQKRLPRVPEKAGAFILYLLRHCSTTLKRQAAACVGFEIAAIATDTLITSWMLGRIVAVIAAHKGDALWQALVPELWWLAALWTFRNVAFRLREYFERTYMPELVDTTRQLLFNRLIQQSHAFLHANFAGVLSNHVRRAADIVISLRDNFQGVVIPLLVRFTVAGILLWQITPVFTLFIAVFVAVGITFAVATSKNWTALSLGEANAASRLTGYIVDSVTNLVTVQQNVGWPEELKRLDAAHAGITNAYRARRRYASWFWGIFDLAMTFFFCGFMALVAYGYAQGHVGAAQLAMTVGLATNLFGAMAGLVNLLARKFDDIGLLVEALNKIATPLAVIDAPAAQKLRVEGAEIDFRAVDFAYAGQPPLFDKLDLKIKPGEKIGLVGISGAGKTTLCQLLMRSYDVTGGGIYIDGQNIAEVTLDSLHAAISVIPQEPMLFHRTLAENIRYGRLDATDAEVMAAAKAAAAHDFIATLPQGYDTLVGERGVKLSGGQRQRVAIARAILRGSPILILDEATSALDSETERDIQTAMLTAMQGRTTLVVAHRLSTLSRMDRIVVMDKGRVIEEGTFADLQKSGGLFQTLWQMQAGGFLPESL